MMVRYNHMSHVMRKTAFCICENKNADQLCGYREADQRLCFRYSDSTIHLLPKSEISSLYPSSVVVQPGLCGLWSETPKTSSFTTRLIWSVAIVTPSFYPQVCILHNHKRGKFRVLIEMINSDY